MTANIWFGMCVHDYHGYGKHTRHLHAADFSTRDGEIEFHLEATESFEAVCERMDKDTIRVRRWKFPILGYANYVGNMLWDAALVTPKTASAIAEVLRQSGKYSPTSGNTELWERWESGKPLFVETSE